MTFIKYNQKSSFNSIKSLIKLLIKKILKRSDYSESNKFPAKTVITNFFNTNYNKTALLSYIQYVFDDEQLKHDKRHTNRYTSYLIAETLNKLGYNVDIIDYNEELNDNFSKYNLIIGLGKTLDYVLQFRKNSFKTKVIWFGTGCNPLFSNSITIKRVKDFYKQHNKLLFESSRYIKVDWPLQHEFSDWIILHGASFAKSTYRNENISTINAPVFINRSIQRTDTEWTIAKQNYLWFGNGGAIHKGLDLVIDAFTEMENYNLHICGNIEGETDFFNYYRSIIESNVHIIYHGFVDIETLIFEKILHNCSFVIYPSASEGNSPSVITCMANGGLIPIVSKNADVDLNGYGILIADLSVEAVINSVKQSQNLSINELKSQSSLIIKETNHYNSFDYFKDDFKQKLQQAINII